MTINYFILALLIFGYSCQGNNNNPSRKSNATIAPIYELYQNENWEILYPKNWEILELDENVFYVCENFLDSSDKYKESINVMTIEDNDASLSEIVDFNIKNLNYNYNTKIEKFKSLNRNGIKYILLKYTILVKGVNLLTHQSFFKRNNQVYIISQTVEDKNKNNYVEMLQNIVDEFKINIK